MQITTISSRELNQDIGFAKKAAQIGPVFITDRGKPAHVLLKIADYKKLTTKNKSLAEVLSMPKNSNQIDFQAEKMNISLQLIDFS